MSYFESGILPHGMNMASFSWDIPMSEQHDNERDKILNELDRLLWFHFPDEKLAGNSPYWGQEPYRGDLFALCCQALGLVNGDQVFQHIRSHWNIQRQHLRSRSEIWIAPFDPVIRRGELPQRQAK